MLEYHAHLVAADVPELLLVHGEDILAVYENMASGRLDEAAKAADQSGLAAAERPYDEGLALLTSKETSLTATDASGLREQLFSGEGRVYGADEVIGAGTEDFQMFRQTRR